jgi:hypothetical protein
MQIKNGKDFWAGLMYMGFGIAFVVLSRNYTMGSALRMGPAYFPTWLGGLLTLLGLIVLVRSFKSHLEYSWRLFEFRKGFFIVSVILGGLAFWQQPMLVGVGPWLAKLVNGIAIILFFGSFGKRSLSWILLVTILFGYLLKPLGIVLTTIILIFGAALAGHEFKFKEITILAIGLAIFCSLAFVKGLGLPFPIWPELRG